MNKFCSNKSEETNQKPASGFLIAHFKHYVEKGVRAKLLTFYM